MTKRKGLVCALGELGELPANELPRKKMKAEVSRLAGQQPSTATHLCDRSDLAGTWVLDIARSDRMDALYSAMGLSQRAIEAAAKAEQEQPTLHTIALTDTTYRITRCSRLLDNVVKQYRFGEEAIESSGMGEGKRVMVTSTDDGVRAVTSLPLSRQLIDTRTIDAGTAVMTTLLELVTPTAKVSLTRYFNRQVEGDQLGEDKENASRNEAEQKANNEAEEKAKMNAQAKLRQKKQAKDKAQQANKRRKKKEQNDATSKFLRQCVGRADLVAFYAKHAPPMQARVDEVLRQEHLTADQWFAACKRRYGDVPRATAGSLACAAPSSGATAGSKTIYQGYVQDSVDEMLSYCELASASGAAAADLFLYDETWLAD